MDSYQVINGTKLHRNRKTIENGNIELEVESYPKKKIKQKMEKQEIYVEYLSCEQLKWIEFFKGDYCETFHYKINKHKYQIYKKCT